MSNALKPGLISLLAAVFCLAVGPLFYVAFTFVDGWFFDDPMYSALPMLGGGLLSAAAWVGCDRLLGSRMPRSGFVVILLAVLAGHYFVSFGLLPSPLQIWSQGLIASLDFRVGLESLQAWGEDAVERFEREKLEMDGHCDFVGGNAPKLSPTEIPAGLKHTWYRTPQIGIQSATSAFQQPSVELSWYGYHVNVGRRSLVFHGTPETLVLLRSPRPGIVLTYWDVK